LILFEKNGINTKELIRLKSDKLASNIINLFEIKLGREREKIWYLNDYLSESVRRRYLK
jgi:hypothetical protein